MKRTRYGRWLGLLGCLLLAAALLLPAYAAEAQALPGTAEPLAALTAFTGTPVADTAALHWRLADGSEPERRTVTGLPSYALASPITPDGTVYRATPDTPLDLYAHRTLSFVVRTADEPSEAAHEHEWRLTLVSGEETLVCRGIVSDGAWCEVTFDIGGWRYRHAVTSLQISLLPSSACGAATAEVSGPYVKQEGRADAFLSDGVTVSGAEATRETEPGGTQAWHMVLANERRAVLSGSVRLPYAEETRNAVRLTVAHTSTYETMTFQYVYWDGETGATATASRTVTLEATEERRSYLVLTGDVERLMSYALVFDGMGAGEVTLYAVEAVSVYEGTTAEAVGSISTCACEEDGRTLTVSGTVFHTFLIAHATDTLCCYRLGIDEDWEAVPAAERTPLATAKMSSRFTFSLETRRLGALYTIARYAVAAVSEDGEAHLLTAPVVITAPYGTGGKETAGIKGLRTPYTASAVSAGASCAVLDVYLDEMTNDTRSGYLYTIGGTHVYYRADVIDALDRQVMSLSLSGTQVYLRLLLSADADPDRIPYVSRDTSGRARYRGVSLATDEAKLQFFAAVDFLCRRYSREERGDITGLILGTSVDRAATHNDVGDQALVPYAETVAVAFLVMARTAAATLPSLEVLLPISDSRTDALGFDSELFLTSLCRYFDDCTCGGLPFTLMLESEASPFGTVQGETSQPLVSVDAAGRLLPAEGAAGQLRLRQTEAFYTAADLPTFENMLAYLATQSASAPQTYWYHWQPVWSDIRSVAAAAYYYQYLQVLFSPRAQMFLLASGAGEDGQAMLTSLLPLLRHIDTEQNAEGALGQALLPLLGAVSYSDLVPGFDGARLAHRTLREAAALTALPETVRGETTYWDFTTAFSTLDWQAGEGVTALACENGRLHATFAPDATGMGDYSDLVYRFADPEDLSYAPYLTVAFTLVGASDTGEYEVLLEIGGVGTRTEISRHVTSGEKALLVADLSAFAAEDKATYLRLRVRPLTDGNEPFHAYVTRIRAYSETLDADALALALKEARAKAHQASQTVQTAAEPVDRELIVAAVAVLGISFLLVAAYERRQKHKDG